MEYKSIPKPDIPHLLSGIRFRHPGYDTDNVLLHLPRVDQNHGSFGIHHATAHTACAIVAANAFQGFLALDAAGTQRVDDPLNEILTADDYFFIVEGYTAGPYPVVASFRDWAFPHGQLPSAWAQAAAGLRDDRARPPICALTRFSLPLESAHLVPQHEADWFSRNGMRQYIDTLPQSIHATPNLLLLRRDVHAIFNQSGLVIVPKIPPPSDSDSDSTSTAPVFVCHFLDLMDYYYAHNSLVNGIHFGSAPFLFVRFAWAILLRAQAFVVSCVSRHVQVATTDDDGRRIYENKFMAAKDLRASYSGGGSISSTPYDVINPYSEGGDFDPCDDDSSDISDGDELAETVATELRQAAAVIVNEVEGDSAS